jgi:hypothetical protein
MNAGQVATITSGNRNALFFIYRYTEIPFVQKFNRTAVFGYAISKQSIGSTIGKGKESIVDLRNNSFDYLQKFYLELQLPAVNIPVSAPNYLNARFAWSQNIGTMLVEECVLKLGGTPICQAKSNLWIQVQSEIFNPFTKLDLINNLQGNKKKITEFSSPQVDGRIKSSEYLLIDLPFTFSGAIEDALPMFLFDGLQPQITFKLTYNIRSVCLYNNIMQPYIDQLDVTSGSYWPAVISIDDQLKCHLRNEAKYYYVVKDVDCKTVSALTPSHMIKISQASTSTLTKAIVGVIRTGDYLGQTFLTYKFTADKQDYQLCQDFANSLANSMIFLVRLSGPPPTVVDPTVVPSEWLGTSNSNFNNIYILDPNSGFIDRSTFSSVCPDKYLRIRVPKVVTDLYTVYVNLNTLAPSYDRLTGSSLFNFNTKIDEITYDCIIDGTIKRPVVTASIHRINIKDCSLCVSKCIDLRSSASKVFDVIVNDQSNTGLFINGQGSWIQEIKHVFLSYDRTLTEYDLTVNLEKLSTFVENWPQRAGMVVISHTNSLHSAAFPNGTADYGKFESTELTLTLKDNTDVSPFLDSPFRIITDNGNTKSDFNYFMVIVKAPLFIASDNLYQEINETVLANFIDKCTVSGNRFAATRIESVDNMTSGNGPVMKKPMQQQQQRMMQQGMQQGRGGRGPMGEPYNKWSGFKPVETELIDTQQPDQQNYQRVYPRGYPNLPYSDLVTSSPCSAYAPVDYNSTKMPPNEFANCANNACARPSASRLSQLKYI